MKKGIIVFIALSFLGWGIIAGNYKVFPYTLIKDVKSDHIAPTQAVTILAPDRNYNSRAFASLIKHKNKFHIFYAARSRESAKYSLFTRSAFSLNDLIDAEEKLILSPEDVDAVMVWMPYIVKANNEFVIFFTVRQGDISYYGDFDEFVMRLTSDDLESFSVDSTVIVEAQLDWEGSEIENWGVINIDETFYMSLESRGPSQKPEDRSIGYAASNNLLNWRRVGEQPSITGGVCCSSFFVFEDYFYSISAAGNRFAVHRAKDFLELTDKNLIGFFYPHDKNYQGVVDTPEVLTVNNKKSLLIEDEFTFMFSSTRGGIINSMVSKDGWVTEYIIFANAQSFLSNLQK